MPTAGSSQLPPNPHLRSRRLRALQHQRPRAAARGAGGKAGWESGARAEGTSRARGAKGAPGEGVARARPPFSPRPPGTPHAPLPSPRKRKWVSRGTGSRSVFPVRRRARAGRGSLCRSHERPRVHRHHGRGPGPLSGGGPAELRAGAGRPGREREAGGQPFARGGPLRRRSRAAGWEAAPALGGPVVPGLPRSPPSGPARVGRSALKKARVRRDAWSRRCLLRSCHLPHALLCGLFCSALL